MPIQCCPELGFRHLTDRLHGDVALASNRRADQQGHADTGGPEFAIAQQDATKLGQRQVVERDVRVDNDRDVGAGLGAERPEPGADDQPREQQQDSKR